MYDCYPQPDYDGYFGVSKSGIFYKAYLITELGEYRLIGKYRTPEAAAKAHDWAAIAEYGDAAVLNFLERTQLLDGYHYDNED